MIQLKRYNALIALFPIVYLIHNLDEWLLFSRRVNTIAELSPNVIRGYIVGNSSSVITIFGVGLIVATLIPLAVSLVIWNKPTILNLKLLIVVAFATLINGFSHVSSSLAFGIIGPGLVTGVLLCIPFSVLVIIQVHQNYHFTLKEYSVFSILSFLVYVLAIAFSWVIGIGFYKLIS